MKKRVLATALLLTMMLCITAQAAQPRASIVPGLTFTGTTANCSVVVSSVSDQIEVVLELWQGNTRIASWNGSGTTYVSISETCTVTKGKTYTLKVTGTINGTAFDEQSVTRTC